MFNGLFQIREPKNETVLGYAPGSAEREALKKELESMLSNPVEVPCIIGGREVSTGDLVEMKPPHALHQSLGSYHRAGPKQADLGIDAANEAKVAWSEMDWSSRATVLHKAAELLAGKYRYKVNAATMLNPPSTFSITWNIGRWRVSSLQFLPSISHRSRATCPPPRR
jgi:1-pyrroline-5-carboxylate dehydrogenase